MRIKNKPDERKMKKRRRMRRKQMEMRLGENGGKRGKSRGGG